MPIPLASFFSFGLADCFCLRSLVSTCFGCRKCSRLVGFTCLLSVGKPGLGAHLLVKHCSLLRRQARLGHNQRTAIGGGVYRNGFGLLLWTFYAFIRIDLQPASAKATTRFSG